MNILRSQSGFIKFALAGLLACVALVSVCAPMSVFAQANADDVGIVPCGNARDASGRIIKECSFYDFVQLINNVINKLIWYSFPVAASVFAFAGIKMMLNPANPGARSESLGMMKKVFIGYAIILSAWLVVSTLANALLKEEFTNTVPVQGIKK